MTGSGTHEPALVPLRQAGQRYADTSAVNDIHALLTSPRGPGDGALAEIAQIIERTGRPMVTARDIEVTTATTGLGKPVVHVISGSISLLICQDPAGTGLCIDITASGTDLGLMAITVNGRLLSPPNPPGQSRPKGPDH